MAEYIAPVKEINFVLDEIVDLPDICEKSQHEGVSADLIPPILDEAAKLANGVLSPLNRVGDLNPARVEDQKVIESPGFSDAYAAFREGGWPSVACDPNYGGMGLPEVIDCACVEMWCGSNLAFSLVATLNHGAINALHACANDEIKQTYLPKMISGDWTGTMNLTEPQAGSDLAVVRTKATRDGDQYRITGTKIYISWGDHQMGENVVHLVLARLPDAPEGVKGISLFVVPKYLVNEDGSLGEHNDVYPLSVEHKMGIHASPTCVMAYGQSDNSEGAIGYLVGQEHHGLMHMFVMMNAARLHIGVEGLGLSERAYQRARDYAKERVQGKPADPNSTTIIGHPDVRRMLCEMRALTEASRLLTYVASGQLDHVEFGDAKAMARVEYLTPVVKGFVTEVTQEITSLGVQIHGGMGFVEETGAAQYYRDARILPIYEGTNGIQALDLIGRKLLNDKDCGRFKLIMSELNAELNSFEKNAETAAFIDAAQSGLDTLQTATQWIVDHVGEDADLPGSIAFHLMMLNGYAIGGFYMAKAAIISMSKKDQDPEFYDAKIKIADFYLKSILPRIYACEGSIKAGSACVMALSEAQF